MHSSSILGIPNFMCSSEISRGIQHKMLFILAKISTLEQETVCKNHDQCFLLLFFYALKFAGDDNITDEYLRAVISRQS